ncbi:MAG: guanylate kinase [Holosporaceae bacterium]|jgi:guanylate kinase|nr:guanylate kinase [Holosporaceae bacterium]
MKKYGRLFVISGPSAVGKTSTINEILKRNKSLQQIVTCTTRQQRKTEQSGLDYFFMTNEEFFTHKKNGDFIECSEIYGNSYGILLAHVKEKLDNEKDALLAANWEGFLKIKKALDSNVYGFFLIPSSLKDLELRIKSRGTELQSVLDRRLELAREDMKHSDIFNFCFENSSLAKTADNILKQIDMIRSGRSR